MLGVAASIREVAGRCTCARQLWYACSSLQTASIATCSNLAAPALTDQQHEDTAGVPPPVRPFLDSNALSGGVTVLEGLPTPTALSWLRRRALPGVPASALYKAFRQRQVRLFDGSRVTRVTKDRPLAAGQQLLFPKELLQLQQHSQEASAAVGRHNSPPIQSATPQDRHERSAMPTAASVHQLQSERSGRMKREWAEGPTDPYTLMPGAPPGLVDGARVTNRMLQRSVLGVTQQAIFLNKPAGLAVQLVVEYIGCCAQGPGPSLDDMMQDALRLGPTDSLRLVHRLDVHVSGVMAVARTQDAATWLSACFKEKEPTQDSTEDPPAEDMGVKRTYWALLAGHVTGRTSGRIRFPVIVNERFRPAVTDFRVRYTSPLGITWVELQPITGRKHQLRVHCARVLGAPIIGDVRHGYTGLDPGNKLGRLLPPAWWQAFSPSTAHRALNPPSKRQRRQMAAQRFEQQRRAELASTGQEPSADDDPGRDDRNLDRSDEHGRTLVQHDSDGSDVSAKKPAGATVPMPVFLHSRRMLLKLPRQEAVRVKAPLPLHMAHVIQAMGWPLPPDS